MKLPRFFQTPSSERLQLAFANEQKQIDANTDLENPVQRVQEEKIKYPRRYGGGL